MIAAENRGQVAVRDVVEGMQDSAEEFGVQYDPPLAEEQIFGYHRQFTQPKHFRGCGRIY